MSPPAGSSFQAAEVVDLYLHRPPYAQEIYERIQNFAPSRDALLDLGCGEGKVARQMTKVFDRVFAVDPSANMITLGKSLENGDAENIEWLEATAENAALQGLFDVVTFASSIHWMEPVPLFTKLKKHLKERHLLAIIRGDDPFEPAWQEEWLAFLTRWVPKVTGRALGSLQWEGARTQYLHHVDRIQEDEFISEPFRQPVEDFIQCQHSRDTFSLSKLGSQKQDFQRELEVILRPHADIQGKLTFQVKTQLTLATLKS